MKYRKPRKVGILFKGVNSSVESVLRDDDYIFLIAMVRIERTRRGIELDEHNINKQIATWEILIIQL